MDMTPEFIALAGVLILAHGSDFLVGQCADG